MTRTLITGVCGFTGRYLARRLADEGDEVHGLVRPNAVDGDGSPVVGLAASHACDLGDASGVRAAVASIRPDRVVHLAAIAFVAHGDINEMYGTNVVGTRHLLHALAGIDYAPEAVLLASSANIYGNAREGALSEDLPPSPANDYGVTKVAVEMLASVYRDRLPLIVTRPFNYTGRGQSTRFVIPKIVDHVRRRVRAIELGNLDVARDFSDVRAVVDAYARLLRTPGAVGETFNVCSGRSVPLRDVLDMLERLSNHAMTVSTNPALVRGDEVRSLCGTGERLEAAIGRVAVPSLDTTLRWMLDA